MFHMPVSRLGKIEAAISSANTEREWFSRNTIERLDVISKNIEALKNDIAELKEGNIILKNEFSGTMKVFLGSQIKDETLHLHKRLTYFLKHLKICKDDEMLEYGLTLILKDKGLWRSIITEPDALKGAFTEREFLAALDEIKKRIFI